MQHLIGAINVDLRHVSVSCSLSLKCSKCSINVK